MTFLLVMHTFCVRRGGLFLLPSPKFKLNRLEVFMSNKKNKGGRPKGSTAKHTAAKNTLESFTRLKSRVASDVHEAYDILLSVMRDPEASATNRKGAATEVIKLHSSFAKEHMSTGNESQEQNEDYNDIAPIVHLTAVK